MPDPIDRWQLAAALASALTLGACAAPAVPSAEPETEAAAVAPAADTYSVEYPKWQTMEPGDFHRYNQRASLVQRGKLVYEKYCIGCHGVTGQGDGPAAARLLTKPRDFTSGIYKFRSTDSSSLPLEADLHRTIDRGLARVSMPAFPLMPELDKLAVIEYVKRFYPDWDAQKAQRHIVPVPLAPDDLGDARRIHRGRVVYIEMQCSQCHGIDGRGTGATQTEYVDAWGHPQKPFDFTRGRLKSGDRPEDVYRTFHTGLRSVMPSYGGDTLATAAADSFREKEGRLDPAELPELEAVLDDFPASGATIYSDLDATRRLELAERNSWDLVAYIFSLRTETLTAQAVLGTSP